MHKRRAVIVCEQNTYVGTLEASPRHSTNITTYEILSDLRFNLDAKKAEFIIATNQFSGIDRSVWNFTNKNVLFGIQFKF